MLIQHIIQRRTIQLLSFSLATLVAGCSLVGVLIPDFYIQETLNWKAQSIGQDIINLVLIVPALLVTSILAAQNQKSGLLLWGGVLLYLVYTFIIYCFAVHFNPLFLVYCLILGLAFYSFLYLLYQLIKRNSIPVLIGKSQVRVTGIYFIIISLGFLMLWLSDIIPANLSATVPLALKETGLFTNPVHIIDLAIFLPGIFMTGILVLTGKPLGFLFVPVILMFFVLMDITIGSLIIIMKQYGLKADVFVALAMILLALFSLGILIWYLKKMKTTS